MRRRRVIEETRLVSLARAAELKKDVIAFLEEAVQIKTGFLVHEETLARKKRILEILGGTDKDWDNWKWQMQNRVRDADLLAELLNLGDVERRRVEKVGEVYRWAISPYYLSLIDSDMHSSPVYRQSVPDVRELKSGGSPDPMNEALTSPAPAITRRYPDRLIINVTNQCAMFCRHCQRRRNIGEVDKHSSRDDIAAALEYVAQNPEIRDVLVTGGDALLLSDRTLEWILSELQQIPHVEIKRIGTRVPVTLPQRVTPELSDILRRYPPIYLNTQFNHPLEITPEAKEACDRLVEAGVVLGNQAVLLRGINDHPYVMRKLNHELLKIRVRPYYIFQAKDVCGTLHWQTSVKKGLAIMESLRGHTSGLAVPTYIVNAPGGLGKIPLMPDYVESIMQDRCVLRNWEGKIVEIEENTASNKEDGANIAELGVSGDNY